jgi:serine/threonine protein kinase
MAKQYQSLSEFQKDYQFDFSDPRTNLGEGSYGEVVKALDRANNTLVALKRSKNSGPDLYHEFEAAKNLNHPNIAKYQSCYKLSDPNVGVRYYAIIELYEGNISKLIGKNILTDSQRKHLVTCILKGLQYLHNQKRIHRDFKPGNILFSRLPDGNFQAHITDFGLTKIINENDFIAEGKSDVILSDERGTPFYKAPEQIEGETAHFNLDLWAFGVILFEMLSGEKPFKKGTSGTESKNIIELQRQIKNAVLPESINQIAEPYQSIIRRCLVKDIHKRVRKESELLDLLDEIPKLLQEAQQFYKNGKFTLAIKKYEHVLHLRPNNQEAKNGLADSIKKLSSSQEPKTDETKSAKKATQNKNEEATDDAKSKKDKFSWSEDGFLYLLFVLPFLAGFIHVFLTNLYFTNQPPIPYFEFSFDKITGLNLAILFLLSIPVLLIVGVMSESFSENLFGVCILAFVGGAITWIVRFAFLEPYDKQIITPNIHAYLDNERDKKGYPISQVSDLSNIGERITLTNFMLESIYNSKSAYGVFQAKELTNVCPNGYKIPTDKEVEFWLNEILVENGLEKIRLGDTTAHISKLLDISPRNTNGFWGSSSNANIKNLVTRGWTKFWVKDTNGDYKLWGIYLFIKTYFHL